MLETASADDSGASAAMLETASADKMLDALFGSERLLNPSAAGPSCKEPCEQEQPEREDEPQPKASPARVLRDPVDVAQRRRRRERVLAARWEAAAHARTTRGILPPREHECAFRLATCQCPLRRLAKQHERGLMDDQYELGSVDRERVRHADLSRRAAITNRGSGASRDTDPLVSLSRRAKNAAARKASWSSRKCNRFRIPPTDLAFPIPPVDVTERCEAATRRAKAAEEAANATWAAIEQDNPAKQRLSKAKQHIPEQFRYNFDQLRNVILTKHRPQLETDLGTGTVFEPFPLSDAPTKAFLGRYHRAVAMSTDPEDPVLTVAAYHGTRSANFKSIAKHGLVVPGHGHGVTVAHGSAHGVGIYTAKLGSPYLSLGFSDTQELLICGVIDCKLDSDTMAKKCQQQRRLKYGAGRARGHRVTCKPGHARGKAVQLRRIGRLPVHRDVPGNIRHVGSAMVIFQEDRVAPLFKALPSMCTGGIWTADPMWWKTGNPNASKASMSGTQRTRQTVIGGEILFLPPGPVTWATRRTKHVKRRQVAKVRDVARRGARESKTALLCMHDSIIGLTQSSN
jgi:hypothetical protein